MSGQLGQVAQNLQSNHCAVILRDFRRIQYRPFKFLFRRHALGFMGTTPDIALPGVLMLTLKSEQLAMIPSCGPYNAAEHLNQLTFVEQQILAIYTAARNVVCHQGHIRSDIKSTFEEQANSQVGEYLENKANTEGEDSSFVITEENEQAICAHLIEAVLWQVVDYIGNNLSLMTVQKERLCAILIWQQLQLFLTDKRLNSLSLIDKDQVALKYRQVLENHLSDLHLLSRKGMYQWAYEQSFMSHFLGELYDKRVAQYYWPQINNLIARGDYDLASRWINLLSPELLGMSKITDIHSLLPARNKLDERLKEDAMLSSRADFKSPPSRSSSRQSIFTVGLSSALSSPRTLMVDPEEDQLYSPATALRQPLLEDVVVESSSTQNRPVPPRGHKPIKTAKSIRSYLYKVFFAASSILTVALTFALLNKFDKRFRRFSHHHALLCAGVITASFLLLTAAQCLVYRYRADIRLRQHKKNQPWKEIESYSIIAARFWEDLAMRDDPLQRQLAGGLNHFYRTEVREIFDIEMLTQYSGSPASSRRGSFNSYVLRGFMDSEPGDLQFFSSGPSGHRGSPVPL